LGGHLGGFWFGVHNTQKPKKKNPIKSKATKGPEIREQGRRKKSGVRRVKSHKKESRTLLYKIYKKKQQGGPEREGGFKKVFLKGQGKETRVPRPRAA